MIHVFSMSPASTLSWYFTSAGSPEGGAGYLVTTGSKIKAVWQVYDDMRHREDSEAATLPRYGNINYAFPHVHLRRGFGQ